jgi:hypothetical protein
MYNTPAKRANNDELIAKYRKYLAPNCYSRALILDTPALQTTARLSAHIPMDNIHIVEIDADTHFNICTRQTAAMVVRADIHTFISTISCLIYDFVFLDLMCVLRKALPTVCTLVGKNRRPFILGLTWCMRGNRRLDDVKNKRKIGQRFAAETALSHIAAANGREVRHMSSQSRCLSARNMPMGFISCLIW